MFAENDMDNRTDNFPASTDALRETDKSYSEETCQSESSMVQVNAEVLITVGPHGVFRCSVHV